MLDPENMKNKNKKTVVFVDETDFQNHHIYAMSTEIATSLNRSLIAMKLPLKAETYNERKKYVTVKLPEGMKPESSIILHSTKKFDLKNYDLLSRREKLTEAYTKLLRQEYIKTLLPNIKIDGKIALSISPREDRKLIIYENMEPISEVKIRKKREDEIKFIKEMKGTRGS